MERLPVELLQLIFSLADTQTLKNLLCINSELHLLASKQLYSHVVFYINPYTGNMAPQSCMLLQQLYNKRTVGKISFMPINHMLTLTVLSRPESFFPVSPSSPSTLWAIFFQILQRDDVKSNLRQFHWKVGQYLDTESFPLPIPSTIRKLELNACYLNPAVIFPRLETLAMRHITNRETSWVFEQVKTSRLKRLQLSSAQKGNSYISLSSFLGPGCQAAIYLQILELECIHLDALPIDVCARLKSITLKYCTGVDVALRSCRNDMSQLEALKVISSDNFSGYESRTFQRLLRSCNRLRHLVLLIGGRDSTIPLYWIQPVQSRLETLVLESRQFVVSPAISFNYSVSDIAWLLSGSPNLSVLGLPVAFGSDLSSLVSR